MAMFVRRAALCLVAVSTVAVAAAARGQMFTIPLNGDVGGQQQAGLQGGPAKKPTPVGTISAGYAYLWADQGGYHRSVNGWLVKPTINLQDGWAVYFDASNYYGANRKGSLNLHTYSLGVSKEVLARPQLKPALFLQMGDSRNSNAGSIVNAYALLTGVNFTTPINKYVSLSVIPLEYVYTHPDGENRNSYNAKFALVFPFGKKRS